MPAEGSPQGRRRTEGRARDVPDRASDVTYRLEVPPMVLGGDHFGDVRGRLSSAGGMGSVAAAAGARVRTPLTRLPRPGSRLAGRPPSTASGGALSQRESLSRGGEVLPPTALRESVSREAMMRKKKGGDDDEGGGGGGRDDSRLE